ncbi:MAG: PEP-CTERM sorting domain-containing protein [Bacteroidota bacterium]|jgi:hypothetical protein
MRTSALLPALLIAASAAAQTNTQLTGVTLTNGITSLSDDSAVAPGANKSIGVSFLTDNSITTYNINLGVDAGASTHLQGTFGSGISSSATGIFIVGFGGPTRTYWGNFTVQLELQSGLTTGYTYGDLNSVILGYDIGSIGTIDTYWAGSTVIYNDGDRSSFKQAYIYVPFSDFGVTAGSVTGIRISNIDTYWAPDVSYIGAGYAGSSPAIPEPSTYGLILGGLALVGAVIRRRRKISK